MRTMTEDYVTQFKSDERFKNAYISSVRGHVEGRLTMPYCVGVKLIRPESSRMETAY